MFLRGRASRKISSRPTEKRLHRAIALMEQLETRSLLSGAPVFTSADTITADVHDNVSFVVTTTGNPVAKITESGRLPSGITFKDNHDGTAMISGIPTSPGSTGVFDFTIKATNSVATTTQPFIFNVDQIARFTSKANKAVFNTIAGGTYTITTTAGFPTPSLSVLNMPNGVTFTDNHNGTGTLTVVSGGVVAPAYYDLAMGTNLTVIATNAAGSPSQNFSLTIDEAPVFTSSDVANFQINTAGSFVIATTGFPDVSLKLTSRLPAGLKFQSSSTGTLAGIGTLSGTPTQSGKFILDFAARNLAVVGNSIMQAVTLTVAQTPSFTTDPAAAFTVGKAGSYTIKTQGFPPTPITEIGALPAGLTFKDNGNGTALISGTPAAPTGGLHYDLTVSADGGLVTQAFVISIDGPPSFTSAAATTFTAGDPGSFLVDTSGIPSAALIESGTLPNGVLFTDNGDGTATLSGTPADTAAGTYNLTLSTKNAGGSATQKFTLTVT